MTGKITRLPSDLREQVNRRLADGQPASLILPWLNGLPEVQQLLKEQFDSEPISQQNLSAYRQYGFRRWQLRQHALAFAAEAENDSRAANDNGAPVLVDQLVNYTTLRFAAAAQTAANPDDPEQDLRQTRHLLADVVALRRGELIAKRLALEQRRLALAESQNQHELENLFWQWTQRPDINKRLYPHRDPDKERRDVVKLLDEVLLGVTHSEEDPEPDPAAWI